MRSRCSWPGHGVPSTFIGITTTGDVDSRQLTEIGGTGVRQRRPRGTAGRFG